MTTFQHVLWGYELTYPDNWIHQTLDDVEGFAVLPEALRADYDGEKNGYLLVRAEWNGLMQALESLWNQHIGLTAGMLGAKKVGAAPWKMGGAVGMEAEISLPQTSGKRLWAGILGRGPVVLHFVVSHNLEERIWFEPLFTQLISSLRFPANWEGLPHDATGLSLPPGYTPAAPTEIIQDIADPTLWRAYRGQSAIGALQAFYLREAQHHGWEIESFDPFPGPTDLGFARFQVRHGETSFTLGLMPYGGERLSRTSPANLVIKIKSSE